MSDVRLKMNFLSYLGKALKSDELLDLLETHDMEVIYDFDRSHENIPDQYWATCLDLGLQLRFDDHQILRTIFLSLNQDDGNTPADLSNSDIPIFGSKQDVRNFASENNLKTTEGETEFFGAKHDWIRLEYSDHSIHYDFDGGPLKKVTIEKNEKE
ncbi:MAG: hypothetical protein HC904_16830 [Blastochloris sp.]|nr:hypothetical protein [Blastochloris sp.]